ncbi:MAG: twin-arginine translocation signal domain-containing protein [Phycisphaerae bacterium]|nr:twin-arginine translocation signal domain-containing protein [Phycisphaerae bacterium]
MCRCHNHDCCNGCQGGIDRRGFLKGLGAAAVTVGGLSLPGSAAGGGEGGKVRVAAVFLANTNFTEIWPYPGFDTEGREAEILAVLREGCPSVEFVPVTVRNANDIKRAVGLKGEVDGYLVYVVTLDWGLGGAIAQIGGLGKPMIVATEFLGGCGVFLTRYSELCSRGVPAGAVSSTRLSDLVAVAGEFANVRKAGVTAESFARRCEEVYRKRIVAAVEVSCAIDPVKLRDIGECVKRFGQSRFLIVGRGRGGQEQDFLGVKGRYVEFDELQGFYEKVDRDEAGEWADRWSKQADDLPSGDYVEPSRPTPDAIQKAGGVYLAMLELLKKYDTDSVTMNCLGGFAAGKLAAYPCLGFMQILNDGGQGVCEAMADDTVSMLMARILTGRPGYVSDPALDTSKNHIVYAHCVATTKAFGPKGKSNGFRIRTLHNRDPRGACGESFLPAGYMTTSFRTNFGRKEMIIHQAKAVGCLDSEYGCRTKLVAEPTGDIGKLFDQWDRFGWHRVTVYGDVAEPLAEFGRALGLKVIEEA